MKEYRVMWKTGRQWYPSAVLPDMARAQELLGVLSARSPTRLEVREVQPWETFIDAAGGQPSPQETTDQNPGNGEPYAQVRGN